MTARQNKGQSKDLPFFIQHSISQYEDKMHWLQIEGLAMRRQSCNRLYWRQYQQWLSILHASLSASESSSRCRQKVGQPEDASVVIRATLFFTPIARFRWSSQVRDSFIDWVSVFLCICLIHYVTPGLLDSSEASYAAPSLRATVTFRQLQEAMNAKS